MGDEMKHVHVARLIGSKGRIWVAFDAAYTVDGRVGQSKRSMLEKFALLHGHYTHVTVHTGVFGPAELGRLIVSLQLAGD